MAAPAEGQASRKPKAKQKAKAKAKSTGNPPTLEEITKAFVQAMPAIQPRGSWNDGKGTKGKGKGKGKGKSKGKGKWPDKDMPPLPCFLFQLGRCGHQFGLGSTQGEPSKRCRFEHRGLVGEEEKEKFRVWKSAQDNPVAAALPGGEICWMWQRTGTCTLGKDCKNADSHKPENAPKDKDGNPIKKGKGKGKGKGKKGKKGQR